MTAVLPSRSPLSEFGLIADLFEKMLLNWSSFYLKSLLFGLKSPKSLIFTVFSLTHKAKNYLKISLIPEYLKKKKVDLLNVEIKFLEQAHEPHAHEPHAHEPHAHEPQAHEPHAHEPHAHGPHACGPHAHGPHAHGPHQPIIYFRCKEGHSRDRAGVGGCS